MVDKSDKQPSVSPTGASSSRVSISGLGPSVVVRFFSALAMVPVAISAVYFGGLLFSFIVCVATIIMIYEWSRMVDGYAFSIGFYLLCLAAIVAFGLASQGYYAYGFITAGFGGFLAWFIGSRKSEVGFWRGFGALYMIVPSLALIWLRHEPEYGRLLTFMLFFIVWGTDSGAYLFGKLLGGPKLSPEISPKKTWSGTVGGITTGAFVAFGFAYFAFGAPYALVFFAIGCCLAIASVLGDLMESAVKRTFGVKDSSGLIPGHGGVLDRLDGMLIATMALTLPLYVFLIFGVIKG